MNINVLLYLSELSLADILTTPSLAKQKQDYFRTPGQILSLISSLGFVSLKCILNFAQRNTQSTWQVLCRRPYSDYSMYQKQNTPAIESKRHCSASAVFTPMSCGKMGRKKSTLCSSLRKKENRLSPGCVSSTLGMLS